MSGILQPSFTSGELAPELHARTDLARYMTGLRRCRNFIVNAHGGVTNRPGLRYVAAAGDESKEVWLFRFQFSKEQSYILEFGDLYMRVHRNGAPVLYPSGHGDEGEVVEIVSPFSAEHLSEIKVAQSADVLYMVHPNYPARRLERTDHHAWSFATLSFTPSISPPSSLSAAPAKSGSDRLWWWVVTAVDEEGEESLPSAAVSLDCEATSSGKLATISWPEVSGASFYNVYKGRSGKYGYIGSAEPLSTNPPGFVEFEDDNIGPAYADTPPTGEDPFAGGNNPGVVAFYQQRLVLGASSSEPQTLHLSQTGAYNSFSRSIPAKADDAIELTIAARQVNQIRSLVPLRVLLAFSAGSEWTIDGGDGGNSPVTPSTVSVKPQSEYGASYLDPIVIGATALYVQEAGSVVRDLAFSLELDGFAGNDLTILSKHFFRGHEIVSWAYAQVPFSVIWCVRDDGKLLSLSYLREHEVWGWALHETEGVVECVQTIPEGLETAVYLVVRREVDGQTRRYVERFASRDFDDQREGVFLDSALSYDGRNTTAKTLTLTDATGWEAGATMTARASEPVFAVEDVGGEVFIEWPEVEENGETSWRTWRGEILAFTSDRRVTVRAIRSVPDSLQDSPSAAWEIGRKRVTGLDHLEGLEVSVLGDGKVLLERERVVDGKVAFPVAAAVIHVGLPYRSEIETLDIATDGRRQLLGRQKLIPRVRVLCTETRGLLVGERDGELIEAQQREVGPYDEPIPPESAAFDVLIESTWNTGGRVLVRQDSPLPATILGLLPEVRLGK